MTINDINDNIAYETLSYFFLFKLNSKGKPSKIILSVELRAKCIS